MTTRRGFLARLAAGIAATKLLDLPREVVQPVIPPAPTATYLYRPRQTLMVTAGETLKPGDLVRASLNGEGWVSVVKADPSCDNILGVFGDNVQPGEIGEVTISDNIFKYEHKG